MTKEKTVLQGAPSAQPTDAAEKLKEFYAEQMAAVLKSLCCHACGRPASVGHAFWCKSAD